MTTLPSTEFILECDRLETQIQSRVGQLRAVNQVSFAIPRGGTLGLVGESGCGKSMTALSILRLVRFPCRIVGGAVWFQDDRNNRVPPASALPVQSWIGSGQSRRAIDLLQLSESAMRKVRGARIAMVFQEPMTALNPVFTIGHQVTEAILAHEPVSNREAEARAVEALDAVSIPMPKHRMREYPHQLSGGLRQRALIAMALAAHPSLLIADEPTTALDVTIQAQILDLLKRLKEEFQLSLLIISHDLGVIFRLADQVCVMYAGRIVEEGPVRNVFDHPCHPYAEALMRAVPRRKREHGQAPRLEPIPGAVPDLLTATAGCAFQPRCRYEMGERCSASPVRMIEVGPGHRARCVKYV